MYDTISRKAALKHFACENADNTMIRCGDVLEFIKNMEPAGIESEVNLCDSCTYDYPGCPARNKDVAFGTGIGSDNIAGCRYYKPAKPEEKQEAVPVAWIEKEIKFLKELDNGFASLTGLNFEAMLKRWREEQNA